MKMNRKYRKTVIAGNWKMNKTPSETKEFMTAFKAMMPKGRWCDIALRCRGYKLIYPADKQCQATLNLPGIPGKRRRRWKCG